MKWNEVAGKRKEGAARTRSNRSTLGREHHVLNRDISGPCGLTVYLVSCNALKTCDCRITMQSVHQRLAIRHS